MYIESNISLSFLKKLLEEIKNSKKRKLWEEGEY